MKKRAINSCIYAFFSCRIYVLFLAVVLTCALPKLALSQEINSFITLQSGEFSQLSTWGQWDGAALNPATFPPDRNHDIYINVGHTLTLTGNEEVKSVYINAQTSAGQKLNLNGYNLDVYGMLHAFSGTAPGTPDNTWNSQNWIGNSESSTITFKGLSRTVVEKSSWSANTTQSRYQVIFDPAPGEILTVASPFKALAFTVRSGTVLQQLDTSVNPNTCFTLSFNTETIFNGSSPFGDLIIENGGTFISECNANIINRSTSGSVSALNFDLQNGGTLILEGSNPRIEAANFQLNGKIIHRGGSTPKNFLASTFADASTPLVIRDLELQGSQNLSFPPSLTVFGSLTQSGTGSFLLNSTSLTFAGSSRQEIQGFPMSVQDLTLFKTGNALFPDSDVTVVRNLSLVQGTIDFGGNDLEVNTSLSGSYTYTGGRWRNLGKLTINGLPATLNASNGSFPFGDVKNGGLRTLQILGNSPGGRLSIQFFEFEGANHDPDFLDLDGTPILYQLYSFFQVSDFSPSTEPVEFRISADSLIVEDVDDLRIVGTGTAAPGTHLPGQNPGLWARRNLTWSEMAGQNLTIGSFREFSILPLTWRQFEASARSLGNYLSWEVGSPELGEFHIFRSLTGLSAWEKIGELKSENDGEHVFSFLDSLAVKSRDHYYQILFENELDEKSFSPVRRVGATQGEPQVFSVWPNPYESGPLHFIIPKDVQEDGWITIYNSIGKVVAHFKGGEVISADKIANLSSGVYVVQWMSASKQFSIRLLKK
jgi:hypothetical protein